MGTPELDLICLGRINVDLYAEQEGAPLEEVQSFRKYLGGSAGNICLGTARLGLKSAMVSRVGDEQMGSFIRSELTEAGADVAHLNSDPNRLTGIITLGVRESEGFPRIFFYENTADLATDETDIDPEYIASARALLITGTFLSKENLEAATKKAVEAAKDADRLVALDVDYRPVLWGMAEHAAGGEMYVASEEATRRIQSVLGACDLVVGTEEEICIAGGSHDLGEAVRRIRQLTDGAIVVKTGARGCLIFEGSLPQDVGDAQDVSGVPVEVFNTVGAGDAFMSGFLRGWLTGETLDRSAQLGNASGALVVTRHGCAPAIPSWEELQYFLPKAGVLPRPSEDEWLEHLHRATTRKGDWPTLCALAVDHRWQLEEMADQVEAPRPRIRELKRLITDAFTAVARDRDDAGILLDDVYGRDLLEQLTGSGHWIGRAIEVARSIPLKFEGGPNIDQTLRAWPATHVVKVMVYAQPNDAEDLRIKQERRLIRLDSACRSQDRELLVELQAGIGESYGDRGVAPMLEWVYSLGVRPDWWKLPPDPDPASWRAVGDVIRREDPLCRGALVLGQTSADQALEAALTAASTDPMVKGFAVGRNVFAGSAQRWLAGEMSDDELVESVAKRYRIQIENWYRYRDTS